VSRESFLRDGWTGFGPDPCLVDWLAHVRPLALAVRDDSRLQRDWLRCQGTWFVGVNALQNDGAGRVADSGPLLGAAMRFIRQDLGFGSRPLDRAQVSICYPGYPRPSPDESDASFRFRKQFDAAHVDGLHPVGPERRRKLLEFSGFLLGMPLTRANREAAPLVVWQGSHRIIGRALRRALGDIPPADWPRVDLTEVYHAARRASFRDCPRVVVHARVGEAYVLHRMTLHGIAPWGENARSEPAGRAILYFRPEIDRKGWLVEDWT